ncbi:transposase [Pseudomonadota bacterium]
MLFKSAWSTLKTFGQDPKRLNGEMGMTAILHSWGQTLSQHIHLHCLIPAGAWNKEAQHWKPSNSHYLFPVRALSRKFRGSMVSQLRKHINSGQLNRINRGVNATLDKLMSQEWNVYCKPHLKRPETNVRYLARYTHKIAIDNTRIENDENGYVTFRYKDYKDHDRIKQMQLESDEFIRRYLLHILPDGFMRIRHYGYLANCCRQKKLPRIRQAIDKQSLAETKSNSKNQKDNSGPDYQSIKESLCFDTAVCPICHKGILRLVAIIEPKQRPC